MAPSGEKRTVEEARAVQKTEPFDLLAFSGGWLVSSSTTALAISALLMNAGVATVSGAFAVLVGIYKGITYAVFGGLNALVPFGWFEISQSEGDILAAGALVYMPAATALFGRSAVYAFVFLMVAMTTWFGVDSRPDWEFLGIPNGIATFMMLLALCSWWSIEQKVFWPFARNLIGAGLIIIALIATGFFEPAR